VENKMHFAILFRSFPCRIWFNRMDSNLRCSPVNIVLAVSQMAWAENGVLCIGCGDSSARGVHCSQRRRRRFDSAQLHKVWRCYLRQIGHGIILLR
jgi:hypothetical protein